MSSVAREGLAAALADRYRIERELGAGGMATVYLAEDLKHDRKVAIKVLKPELAAVLGAERFVVEIKTTAALQHPHILPLFDSGTADGFLFYVMPYIEGETIREKLNRETQCGVDEAVRITREIADALDYAHRHGVIHRDIKPENILLHDGRAMVMDFGIALAVSAAAGGRMTETGLSLGTPHYMSPEQATAEREITGRSDQYSLATVLYEMLTGSPPHTGASAQQIIMKIITEPAAPVTSHRKSVPPNIAAALSKALEKLPADRFESVQAFAAALANGAFVSNAVGAATRPMSVDRRWKLRATVASGVALLVAALAIAQAMRPAAGDAGKPWQVRMVLPDSAPVGENLSLSPDGATLVYDGGGRLWMRRANGVTPVAIAGTEGGEYATISPDGKRVAFMRVGANGEGQIVVMPVDGGELKTVVTDPEIGSTFGWTDADHIVYPATTGLMRASVTGGDVRRMTTVDTARHEVLHVNVSGLPGGGALFLVASRNSDSSYIGAVGPAGGSTARVAPGIFASFAQPGHLIVTRSDGSIVAIPFDEKHLRITGAPVSLVSGLRSGVFSTVGRATVSASGRLVFVSSGWLQTTDPTDAVWVTRAGARTAEDPGRTLMVSVALSPDARRVATGFVGEASEEIRIREFATGAVRRVAIAGTMLRDPVFSRDGRQLFFMGLGASHGVHRLDLNSAAPPVRLGNSEFTGVAQPVVDSSGEVVYYWSAKLNGVVRYDIAANKTTPVVLPATGSRISRPQLSPDGRWLAFFSTASGKTLVRVRSTDSTQTNEWSASSADQQSSLRWSRAGDELFFVERDSMRSVRVTTTPSFTLGNPRALFSTAGLTKVFDVGPDGRFFMIRPRPDTRPLTELTMFERWTALLPK